jgi:hypothetical protein
MLAVMSTLADKVRLAAHTLTDSTLKGEEALKVLHAANLAMRALRTAHANRGIPDGTFVLVMNELAEVGGTG